MSIRIKYFKKSDVLLALANVALFLLLSFVGIEVVTAYVITFIAYAIFLIVNNFYKFIGKLSGNVVFLLTTESAITNLLILELFLR